MPKYRVYPSMTVSDSREVEADSPDEAISEVMAEGFLRVHICQDCGVLVTDRDAHDGFHAALESTARAADRGDMMTRCIG